jgi:prephenate dehydrogenase
MDPNIIIAEIERHARTSGLKPSTICQLALGNPRYFDRLRSRIERFEAEADRIRKWVAENAPEATNQSHP